MNEVFLSPVEEIDVRSIYYADFPHSFLKVRGLGKALRAGEILRLEKKDDFIRVISSPKKVLLPETGLNAFREVSVISALPFREIPDFMPDD